MEKTVQTLQMEFEIFIREKLIYTALSGINFQEYKSFVFDLFKRLNELKGLGINKDRVKDFINTHYSDVMQGADDSDVLFERRFSAITEEIVEFCPDPFFGILIMTYI